MHQTFFKHDMTSRVETANERKAADDKQWRACCAAVDLRDGRQCRACDRKSDPDRTGLLVRGHRHHIIYRSAGGPDETWNICTLCHLCHDAEHVKRTLDVDGNADVALTFARKDANGDWYIDRQEIGVRQVLRD